MRTVLCCLLVLSGCARSGKTYDTEVEILRLEVIRADEQGNPLTVDVEMQFEKCPGDQRKTIRGDKTFAACILKHKAGEIVPAKLSHDMDDHGELRPHILGLAGCEHRIDPNDEAAFEVVQVCTDLVVNSVKVGFHCDRRPSPQLLAACPWFRTR
jgi:hypothetical protein